MRHQEHRAGIVADHLFQHDRAFRGRDRWSARPAPAGWRAWRANAPASGVRVRRRTALHGRAGLLRREQEVLHVADDMLALSADDAPCRRARRSACRAPRCWGRAPSRRWSSVAISILAPSVMVPVSGREFAGQHLRAAWSCPRRSGRRGRCGRRAECGSRSRRTIGVSPIRLRRCASASATSLPEMSASVTRDLRAARAPRYSRRCSRRSCRMPTRRTLRLRRAGDAVAQPVLLGDDLAVELVLLALFFREHLVAPFLERREAALDRGGSGRDRARRWRATAW